MAEAIVFRSAEEKVGHRSLDRIKKRFFSFWMEKPSWSKNCCLIPNVSVVRTSQLRTSLPIKSSIVSSRRCMIPSIAPSVTIAGLQLNIRRSATGTNGRQTPWPLPFFFPRTP